MYNHRIKKALAYHLNSNTIRQIEQLYKYCTMDKIISLLKVLPSLAAKGAKFSKIDHMLFHPQTNNITTTLILQPKNKLYNRQ